MKSTFALLFLLAISANNFAQSNLSFLKKPRYSIHLTTMQGNMLKGLLLLANDSSLIIYPGNRKEWNKKTDYYPVVFICHNVKEIKLGKKNALTKGMLIGGGTGLSAILTTTLLSNATAKGEAVNTAAIAIPAGLMGGAYMGVKNKKNYFINGSSYAFNEFEKQIQ